MERDAYSIAELGQQLERQQLGVVQSLAEFPPEDTLTMREKVEIVEVARSLLSRFYVHLPHKQTAHGANPEQLLTVLENRLRDLRSENESLPDSVFHQRMTEIFTTLRDRHTSYVLPSPYRRTVAFLPFMIERCNDPNPTYVITKTCGSFSDPDFKAAGSGDDEPVVVTHWSGIPINRVVQLHADRNAGANPAAQSARALDRLTFRWLGASGRPDEDWIVLTYRVRGEQRHLRCPWAIVQRPVAGGRADLRRGRAAVGRDAEGEWLRRTKYALFGGESAVGNPFGGLLRCETRTHRGEEYGYLRIFSFAVGRDDIDGFVDTVARFAASAPPAGLVVDIRGNPGGDIVAAERLLQLFSPTEVESEGLQFINTPGALKLAERYYDTELDQFARVRRAARATASAYVKSPPLAAPAVYNAYGQTYQGPVVVIVDALTYSAAEIFAAGMEDHELATIVGTSTQTGGGGANVWPYELLRELADDRTLIALPSDAGFNISVRRTTRVREEAGVALEDLGVVPLPEHYFPLTRNDLLDGNRDLLERAMEVLREGRRYHLSARFDEGRRAFLLSTHGLTRVDVYFDGRPYDSITPRSGETAEIQLKRDVPDPDCVRFAGFATEEALPAGAERPIVSFRWSRPEASTAG